ncbi:type IV pilus modification protein PilV [Xenophilus sp. Marseille-Q4582]|uniref:type IV pilus modification protein PilV n=1 Tax=Xenophilus sp. Marseille-Q4582 TaxID=2866600 RepID=UPI001CE3FEAD|nr:type IV pilus modification protein PilV [Xenophilus sp. Marseille-Q4582]
MNDFHLQRAPRPGVRTRHARGFSLIEVLVSVLLLSLGLLGLIGLQARTMEMSGEAEDRNRAAMLADDAASLMWMQRSVTLDADTLTAWENAVAAQLPNGEGSITSVSGEPDRVDVTITWRPPARASDDGSRLHTRVVLSQDPTP